MNELQAKGKRARELYGLTNIPTDVDAAARLLVSMFGATPMDGRSSWSFDEPVAADDETNREQPQDALYVSKRTFAAQTPWGAFGCATYMTQEVLASPQLADRYMQLPIIKTTVRIAVAAMDAGYRIVA